jgi:hypothetical protein
VPQRAAAPKDEPAISGTAASSGDCQAAYYQPLLDSMQVRRAPAHLGTQKYTEVSSEQGTSFEVPLNVPHADRLNRYAFKWLQDQQILAIDCSARLSSRSQESMKLDSALKPVVWNSRFMVLEYNQPEIFCGGAHGESWTEHIVWAMPQGQVADTWLWLKGGRSALEPVGKDVDGEPEPSKLVHLLNKTFRSPEDQDRARCGEEATYDTYQAPYPSDDGLVFPASFGWAMRVCNDEVTLSWKDVAPYLSKAGKAVAANWPRRARKSR